MNQYLAESGEASRADIEIHGEKHAVVILTFEVVGEDEPIEIMLSEAPFVNWAEGVLDGIYDSAFAAAAALNLDAPDDAPVAI